MTSPPDEHQGRLGLELINHADPDQKPFTASGLMHEDLRLDQPMLYGTVAAGTPAWIRLTGLSSKVAGALLTYARQTRQLLASGTPLQIELDCLPWKLTGVHIDDRGHPWAGQTTYQALIDRHTPANPAAKLERTFASATTFRSQRVNLPLPLPSLVFGSLLTRWMLFTAHRLRDLPHEQLDAYIQHHVLLSPNDADSGQAGGQRSGICGQCRL